jgi:hypothetical protein
MKIKRLTATTLLILATFPIVFAHTPFGSGGENNSIDTAVQFDFPTKSWTMYRELHEAGEVEYFKLHLLPGDRLQFSVSTPRSERAEFVPKAVVLSPNSKGTEDVPTSVEIPIGYGASLINGVRPDAPEYEAFTPTSYYFVLKYSQSIKQEGDYYFAVYEPNMGGRYNLAVGYLETFSLVEWLKIPFDVINIHLWEGEGLLLIFTPLLATIIIGLPLLFRRSRAGLSPGSLIGYTAGLLYIGTGLMTTAQMIMAAMGATGTNMIPLTLIFAIIPITLGLLILRKALKSTGEWSIRDRVVTMLLAVFGLVFWAGLVIGPILTMIFSLVSPYNSKK